MPQDKTKFNVSIGEGLSKRIAMFRVVKFLADKGVDPNEIKECMPSNSFMRVWLGNKKDATKAFKEDWKTRDGELEEVYFIESDEVFEYECKTYFLTNQWERRYFDYTIDKLQNKFPEFDIRVEPSNP